MRAVRTREVLRCAVADLAGLAALDEVGRRLSDATVAAIAGGLAVAERKVLQDKGLEVSPTRLAVIGLGRLGGGELGYGSDADVVFVHDPVGDADGAQEFAHAVFGELRSLLRAAGPTLTVDLDTALRPEGRDGPLVRSLESYAQYYERWSAGWEAQALLRAVPVAGDDDLGDAVHGAGRPAPPPGGGALVRRPARDAPDQGAGGGRAAAPRGRAATAPEARARRPRRRGVDRADAPAPARGGARGPADDLDPRRAAGRRGGTVCSRPTTGRRSRRRGCSRHGCGTRWCCGEDAPTDVVPTDRRDLDGVAQVLGRGRATAGDLEDEVLRTMRHARVVVERVFYG